MAADERAAAAVPHASDCSSNRDDAAFAATIAPESTGPRAHHTADVRPGTPTLSTANSPYGPETLTGTDSPSGEAPARVEIPGYEIEAQLGQGGMGVVFRARHVRLNRLVAIKMILGGPYATSESRVRFLSEAEAIAKLHHAHIVQVYEFGQHEGYPYFTLEFLEGGTLDRSLRGVPMAANRAARLLTQLASAVQHAHERGIIHRDLKPSNILLDTDETPKISDFGLAKQIDGGSGITQSGSILGTPSYMAPEQAGGKVHEIGPFTDVYALGAILYECLTGRPPFRGSTTIDTINQVLTQEPVAPRRLVPSIPQDIETLCLKCLQKSPGMRYASAGELADDLNRFLAGETIRARPIGRMQRGIRWTKRHPSAAALIGVVAAGLLVLVLGSWWYSLRLQDALSTAEERRNEAESQKAEAEWQKQLAETQRQVAESQRKEAETQTRIAEIQTMEAEKQKLLVAAGLQRRVDVMDDLLVNLDGRLAQKAGAQSLRMEFLVEFLRINQGLMKDQGDDPAVRLQTARVHRSVGDLCRESRNLRDGEPAYAQAAKLHEGLAKQFPEKPEYQAEFASTTIRRAILLWTGKQVQKAREQARIAVAAVDVLATKYPQSMDYRRRTGTYRYYLANYEEAAGAAAESRATYAEALKRQEEMVANHPTRAEYHSDLATTLAGLAILDEPTDPAKAQRQFERSHTARAAALNRAPALESTKTAFEDSRSSLCAFYVRNSRHAELAKLAETIAAEAGDDRSEIYNAACQFSQAVAALRTDTTIAPEARAAALKTYAERAVALLHRSVEAGNTDRSHFAVDLDLDPLRERPDFIRFMDQLAVRFPNRPVTPAALFDSLQGIYTTWRTDYVRHYSSAATPADRKRADLNKPDLADFGERILKLAEKHPEAPASLEALVWLVESTPKTETDPAVGRMLQRVLVVLKRDHLTKPEFVNACRVLAATPVPGGNEVLEAAQNAKCPLDVRGFSAYALALSLMSQAEDLEDDVVKVSAINARAEKQLESVCRDFETVPFGRSTLGVAARKKLVELRSLSVGRIAGDIAGNDLDGRPLKLSEFRGQVVLISFWANWCGYCRQFYPHAKNLVEKYKSEPFALLGVNADEDAREARRAVDRHQLTWRSWFDGAVTTGRPTEKWQVDGYPSLFLLDGSGVIRKRWQGKPDEEKVDEAVRQLLREQARKK